MNGNNNNVNANSNNVSNNVVVPDEYTKLATQQDTFEKSMARIALQNQVNPNEVFDAMGKIPLDTLFKFVMGQPDGKSVAPATLPGIPQGNPNGGLASLPNLNKLAYIATTFGGSVVNEGGPMGHVNTSNAYAFPDANNDMY